MKVTGMDKKRRNTRKIWIPIVIVVLLAGAAGYYFWTQQSVTTASAATATLNTSQVRQGSISISASGSGKLVAGQEKNLAFTSSGTVKMVNVQAGDLVEAGQVLAELGGLDELQAALNSARQELTGAQKELQTLKDNAPANIANAQLDLAAAQKAVMDAKSGLITPGSVPCDQDTIEAYYYKYVKAAENLEALGDGGDNQDYYLKTIVPAKNAVAQAYATYESCIQFTEYEITSSQATLSLEEANLKLARERLEVLTAGNGLDPVELAQAENQVAAAQLAVDQAVEKLAGTTLTAPISGTVLSVAGEAGDQAGTGTFITIADLAHPRVEFSIDETDMDKAVVGENATVSFDAIPDLTFTGKVIRINPELTSSNGYQVITGLIELDLSALDNPPTLIKGLTASVELVQASAKDVLIVPVEAVRDLGDGRYGVFVVDESGKTRLAFVEVGLMDAASAEIKSGLKLGDLVSTGDSQLD